MRAQNYGNAKVAGTLNSEGVLSPREYEYHIKGKEYPYDIRSVWYAKAVKDITKNEAYLGHRVQMRQGVVSYKNHKIVQKPEEEWIRVENAHTPLIDQDTWNAVREINEKAKAGYKGKKPTPTLFNGILRCADCGGTFNVLKTTHRYPSGVTWSANYYKCARYALSGGTVCTAHNISENALKQILLADIQRYAAMISTDRDKVIATLQSRVRAEPVKADNKTELECQKKRLGELDRKMSTLYEDKVSGAVSGQTFTMALREYESERETATAEHTRLMNEQDEAKTQAGNIPDWMELVIKHSGVQDIDRDMLTELVERIEIQCRQLSEEKA